MALLKIHLQNSEKLIRVLQTAPGRILAVLGGRTIKLMYQLRDYVVSQKLSGQVLKVQTGILRASVRVLPTDIENGRTIVGKVRAAEPPAGYGVFHESGARPHDIIATRARMLKFVAGGRERYAAMVRHPGLPARRFMQSSLDENAESMRASLQAAVDEELEREE